MAKVMRKARISADVMLVWDDKQHGSDPPYKVRLSIDLPYGANAEAITDKTEWVDNYPRPIPTLDKEKG